MQNLRPEEVAIVKKWNLFCQMLLDCERTWKEFLALRENTRFNSDNLPPQAGKFFGLATSRSTFMVAVARLLDYARKYSSIEEMIVKLPEEKREEKANVEKQNAQTPVVSGSRRR
jgi:hypothetical protein